ncbi:MAG TPA: hypothetical protein VE869_12900 [Gemmatimonas sp.]|nr:hypothetical protein [Gemmatimonas sp.]
MSQTVLVYGHDRARRLLLKRLLTDAGFRTLVASSRAEAAKCLAATTVELIVVADRDSAQDTAQMIARHPDGMVVGRPIPFLHLDTELEALDPQNDAVAAVRAALSG